jgi:two-component system, chemotaxis family, protein-glutamate methylesterase/glutaminase
VSQDEESCVVGMPREAIKRGGAEKSLPLGAMAQEILKQL